MATTIRSAASFIFAICLTLALLAGCAAPGTPSPRHPVVPTAVTDLAVRQYGGTVALAFTVPLRSVDGELLAERPAIEIYRSAILSGTIGDKKTAWRQAYTIPSEQMDSYVGEGRVEFRDPLTAADFARPPGASLAYMVRARAAKARASEDSNIVATHIYQAPEAPRDVHAAVTESAVIVTWSEAPVPPGASSLSYRVYRGESESAQQSPARPTAESKLPVPLALAGPSTSTDFLDSHFQFGTAYLYTVRTVAQFGGDVVESADSVPAIVTPRDIFPPATPTALEIAIVPATSQGPAYIELSWAISTEGDLAGYFVYRSNREDVPGERVAAEILPSPTFRDMSVLPGRLYYYRVSAVDRAGNESPKSSAIRADVP